MAGKKKSRKAQSNPARGFATTSTQRKPEAKVADPSDASADEPAIAADSVESKAHPNTEDFGVETDAVELSADQFELQLEEAELQGMLDKHWETSHREAARYVSRLKAERRLLRSSGERFSLNAWISEDSLQLAWEAAAASLQNGDRPGRLPSDPVRLLSEDELSIRIWTLQQALRALDFTETRVRDALVHLLQNITRVGNMESNHSKDGLWGAEECIEYLASSCNPDELPGHNDHHKTQFVSVVSEHFTSEGNKVMSYTASGDDLKPTNIQREQQSDLLEAPEGRALNHETDSSHDSDSDVDPKDQVAKYLQFKARLHRSSPHLTVKSSQKKKTPKGRRSPPPKPAGKREAKLQQRIRKLERDLLFPKEEAEEAWQKLRAKLESEAAMLRRTEKKPPDLTTLSAVDPVGNAESEEDTSFGVGDFFQSLPEQSGGVQDGQKQILLQDISGVQISFRDFGKWTGAHPRRVLEDFCKSRDSAAKLTVSVLSSASFSHRHTLEIHWTQLQDIPRAINLPGVDFVSSRKLLQVRMNEIACPDRNQSEAYVATVALFLINSSSSKEEKTYLRLPSVWRALWLEFTEARRLQEVAAKREELSQIRLLVREHWSPQDLQHSISKLNIPDSSPTVCSDPHIKDLHVSVDHAALDDMSRQWMMKTSAPMFQKMLVGRENLPIWRFKDSIIEGITQNQAIILCGETGCGKSTQVPSFILENELSHGRDCRIYCTQPRRISALSLARRVSEELGEQRGDLGTDRSMVGYSIRLESRFTPKTKLIYATTGILMRMLENPRGLDQITHLVVDEVHERTIDSDFLLIVLRRLLSRRQGLKVILMSATVDAVQFSQYLGHAPIFNIPGRTFPVDTVYLEDAVELTNYWHTHVKGRSIEDDFNNESEDERREQTQMRSTHDVSRYSSRTRDFLSQFNEYRLDYDLIFYLLNFITTDDRYRAYGKAVLVFLPGIAEIRRLSDMLLAHDGFTESCMVFTLHSTISTEDQERAFAVPPEGFRKIVLATNIAETGITIPDITCVIDSGKHREIRYDEKRQLSRLLEAFISKSNAKQRRGRAGRVRNGLCFHLFTQARYDAMPEAQTPEMLRLSLQDLALRVKICNLGGIEQVFAESLDPPLPKNIRRAIDSLVEVGALTTDENLTGLGRQLAKLPLDVYLGKFLVFSSIFNCVDAALSISAILTSKSPFLTPLNAQAQSRLAQMAFQRGNSDLLTVYNAYLSWRRICINNPSSQYQYCRKNFLNPQTLSNIEDLKIQLAGALVEAGFLHLNDKDRALLARSRGHTHQRSFLELFAGTNDESGNDALVNSVIAWSFYPKLLIRDGKGYRSVANNQPVSLHPSSVNKGEKEGPKFLSFYHIMRSSSRFYNAHETSAVDALAIALLCGDADIRLYSGTMTIDSNRLRFIGPDWRTMLVLKRWRTQFQEFIMQQIEVPRGEPEGEQRLWFDLWQHALEDSRPNRS